MQQSVHPVMQARDTHEGRKKIDRPVENYSTTCLLVAATLSLDCENKKRDTDQTYAAEANRKEDHATARCCAHNRGGGGASCTPINATHIQDIRIQSTQQFPLSTFKNFTMGSDALDPQLRSNSYTALDLHRDT